MKPRTFINDFFLLQNETARRLFHELAADLPVIDYHNHLPPGDIAANRQYENITELWLAGDHYKWRAMRTCGVDEELITGTATDKEKFFAWAEIVPKTIKNPLYHWTHLELSDPFGITTRLLNGETAEAIWDECNEMLQQPSFSARSLLKRRKVEVVATTDDPADSLTHHQAYAAEKDRTFEMVPTFRPDKGMNIRDHNAFNKWLQALGEQADQDVRSFSNLLDALQKRHNDFHEMGCRASDHGVEEVYSEPFTLKAVERTFQKAVSGENITESEERAYKSAYLYFCGLMNAEKGWVYQLHIGAIRNNNTRFFKKLGPDSGFDSIGDTELARPLARLLDRLDSENKLPKTVLYNINPRDNELMATMAGNFQDGTVAGKVQHGPPWWFLDQKNGIENQIESLSNMGIVSEFIGMTTDSRSFLSFSRHDYFRRILCNIIGKDAEQGLIPSDMEMMKTVIEKICFSNAKKYFNYPQTSAPNIEK
jgi:glucuronate isomerase